MTKKLSRAGSTDPFMQRSRTTDCRVKPGNDEIMAGRVGRYFRRREFISLLAGTAAAWPLGARAEQRDNPPVVGYLAANSQATDQPRRTAFAQRLGELGWVDGRSVRIEYRWADGVVGRAAAFAAEFVQMPVNIIVTAGDAYVLAAKRTTTTIPIVFAATGDPVGNGLVASLARPGGNVTGLSLQLTETVGKRLELMRELVPALRRLAILFNSGDPQVKPELEAVLAAAQMLNLEIVTVGIRPDHDIAPAIEPLRERIEAIYACTDPLVNSNATRINASALSARLPIMHSIRQNAEAGGLISYGPDLPDMSRRAAELVDKFLRGAKPGELPVEQPIKFDLVVDLKTAKTLGLAVPHSVLVLADEVIE